MPAQVASENTTEVKEWSVPALKAYLEQQINALAAETDLKFEGRDKALVLQSDLNKEHFAALNHEAARILKATEITVSRDTWDAFIGTLRAWQATVDRTLQESVSKSEFQTYKETTDKMFNVQTGQTQALSRVMMYIAAIGTLFAVGIAVWNMLKP